MFCYSRRLNVTPGPAFDGRTRVLAGAVVLVPARRWSAPAPANAAPAGQCALFCAFAWYRPGCRLGQGPMTGAPRRLALTGGQLQRLPRLRAVRPDHRAGGHDGRILAGTRPHDGRTRGGTGEADGGGHGLDAPIAAVTVFRDVARGAAPRHGEHRAGAADCRDRLPASQRGSGVGSRRGRGQDLALLNVQVHRGDHHRFSARGDRAAAFGGSQNAAIRSRRSTTRTRPNRRALTSPVHLSQRPLRHSRGRWGSAAPTTTSLPGWPVICPLTLRQCWAAAARSARLAAPPGGTRSRRTAPGRGGKQADRSVCVCRSVRAPLRPAPPPAPRWKLSYHVSGAPRRPLYDLALDGERLVVSYLAEVTQQTEIGPARRRAGLVHDAARPAPGPARSRIPGTRARPSRPRPLARKSMALPGAVPQRGPRAAFRRSGRSPRPGRRLGGGRAAGRRTRRVRGRPVVPGPARWPARRRRAAQDHGRPVRPRCRTRPPRSSGSRLRGIPAGDGHQYLVAAIAPRPGTCLP